jgi:phosphohistidine phosphatase
VRSIKSLGLEFDLVLTSPYLRARQTAEIAVRELRLKTAFHLAPELGADSTPRRLLRGILQRELPPRILLVGHEPLFSETISLLLSGGPSLAITLKKGGLAMLAMEQLKPGCCATLEWLLTPRQLCRLR